MYIAILIDNNRLVGSVTSDYKDWSDDLYTLKEELNLNGNNTWTVLVDCSKSGKFHINSWVTSEQTIDGQRENSLAKQIGKVLWDHITCIEIGSLL